MLDTNISHLTCLQRMAMLTSSALDRLKAAISHWVSKFAARRLTERVWLAWRHAHFTTVMRRLQQGLGTDTTHDCSLRTMGGDIDCCAAWGPHTEVPKPIPKPCHRDQGQVNPPKIPPHRAPVSLSTETRLVQK